MARVADAHRDQEDLARSNVWMTRSHRDFLALIEASYIKRLYSDEERSRDDPQEEHKGRRAHVEADD